MKNLITLLSFLMALSVFAHANCAGTPEISDARIKTARSLLVGDNSAVNFNLYSEATGTEIKAHFLLYSIAKSNDAPATMYLAATTHEDEKLLFTHNLSYYTPPITRTPVVVGGKPDGATGTNPSPLPPSALLILDGCLNTFTISPKRQGIHLSLFAKSLSLETEGADDVLLVLLENNFIEPVLELALTSFHSTGRHGVQLDSVIALLPSATETTEVVWKQFSQESVNTMMLGGFTQNALYRWEDKGFKRSGTLSTPELAARMKTAVKLPRCNSIVQIRFEDKMPGPNQPAP